MTSQGKKISKSTIVLLAVIVVLVAVVIVQAVMLGGAKKEQTQTGTHLDNSALAIGANNTEPTVVEETAGEELTTRYINLFLPADLVEEIDVAAEETDDGVTIVFSGAFSGKTLELFSITISRDAGDGYVLGGLDHETEGKLAVTMQMNEQKAEDWDDNDYVRINSLQERVNDIIVQFYEDPRFIPAH